MASAEYGYSLYYPYIHFHDEKWLKLAALYYDGLGRIVPQGFEPNDSHTASVLRGELNFIRDLPPDVAEVDLVASEFLGFLVNEFPERQKARDQVNKIRAVMPQGSVFNIHSAKMAPALRSELQRLKLAKRSLRLPWRDGDWYEFEPGLGALYMTCLANRMAGERAMPVVSDDPVFQPLIRAMQSEFDPESQLSGKGHIFASFVIESYSPKRIEDVSVDSIVRFRRKHDDERRRFYDEVNKLAADITLPDNQSALSDCLNHHQKKVADAVDDLRGALRGAGIDCGVGLLGLSVPSWASSLAVALPPLAPGIISVGAIVMGIGAILKGGQNYRSKLQSPWTYVLSLEKGIDSKSFMEKLFQGTTLL